ncbi:MAG: DUF58 domain-containing protein [Actinobacteria bacterium]|nr:MAG: DUF58 domain-containing protein [Actinomycetota bacterium]
MPTRRGWAAFGAGISLWIVARFIGSPDLHMVAAGISVMPFLAAAFVHWSNVRLEVHRNISMVRVFPGTRVVVSLTITNHSRVTAPFLLLEDALPHSLGTSARLVVAGLPPRNHEIVSYSVLCRRRGRFTIGPLSIFISDPFGLARVRINTPTESELIVYPEVEDIDAWNLAMHGAGTGESSVRHLQHSAAEFYTMREYVTGDDLRRIHWPSVARTGQLMIRQDEATRRSNATLFLDNRSSSLGQDGSPGFERAVSVAATVGRLLTQKGFSLRFARVDAPAIPVGETRLLETLASVSPARLKAMSDALVALRASARSDSSLALVTAPPLPIEVQSMLRIGSGFRRKLAVFVYPANTTTLPDRTAAEIEARATSARTSLQHAGWDVVLIQPDGRLAEVWQATKNKRLRPVGSFS